MHARSAAIKAVVVAVTIASVAGARSLTATSVYPQPCVTIDGPGWTQTINLTAHQAPPKTARLRALHGRRY